MSQSVISNYLTRGAATRRPPTTIAGPSNSSNKRDKGKAVVREIDPEVSIIPNPPATISSPAPISDGNQDTRANHYCQMRKAPPKSRYSAREFDIQWSQLRYEYQPLPGKVGYNIQSKKAFRGHDTASVIWQYGADLEHLHKGSRQRFWLCERCHLESKYHTGFFVVNGYNSIFNHLGKIHDLWFEKGRPIEVSRSQSSTGMPTTRDTVSNSYFDSDGFLRAIVDWTVIQDLTYRQVTSQDTRNIITFDRPELAVAVWEDHKTLSKHVRKSYEDRFTEIAHLLKSARTRIHVSCDIWTSTNGLSLLGTVAHFVDKSNTKRTVLVALPRLRDRHSGENIARCLHEVLQRFEVADNLGAFIMDNAKNNETAMRHLQRSIPTLNDEDRVFCAGHCFNLVVKAMLFGQASQFEKDLAGASDTETFQLWRRRGSIGKAHNIVKYISRSDQRRQAFARACIAAKTSDNAKDVTEDEDTLFDHCEDVDGQLGLIQDGGGL
jgi:hypothetical protein